MTFEEAVKALIAGNYVARDVWATTAEYCVLMPGMTYIWKILTQPNPNAGNWLPLVEDLKATDWAIITKIEAPVAVAAEQAAA